MDNRSPASRLAEADTKRERRIQAERSLLEEIGRYFLRAYDEEIYDGPMRELVDEYYALKEN